MANRPMAGAGEGAAPSPQIPFRANESGEPIVRLSGAWLDYVPGESVLQDVSFSLAPGSLTVLAGPSGAGKSTLLRLLCMELSCTAGIVELFGKDVSRLPRRFAPILRQRVGVMFQDFRLLDHLSAFENVALPLRVAGKRPESYFEDVEELLRWVGLKSRIYAYPNQLSGGERQRVALARAVVTRPELLIMDEPTGNIDPETSRRILHLLTKLNRSAGKAVVIASHDERLADELGADLLRLRDGRVVTLRPGLGGGQDWRGQGGAR